MSKYYKAEDVIRAIAEQLCWEARTEYGDKFTTEDWLEEAEDYVSDLPTIEVSEDCISREYILGEAFASDEYNRETKSFDLPVVSVSDIEDAPSVLPSRAEGEWAVEERDSYFGKKIILTCSECGDVFSVTESEYPNERYCRYCGAKMKGQRGNE